LRLVLIAIVLPLTGVLSPARAGAEPMNAPGFLVTASWLAQLGSSPDIVIVDGRPPEAYAQGHIPGAVNLPSQNLATRSSEEVETGPWRDRTVEQLGTLGISPSNIVVAYDDQGSCSGRSASARATSWSPMTTRAATSRHVCAGR
jgi:3-mercaptopyruvate sulfurtransferase SseA